MLHITPFITIDPSEVTMLAIRAQGAGGQNVNKVSSAIHLRFDIKASSLPESYKQRLLTMHDHRITESGEIIIKAQQFRTQEKNREDALTRLVQLIRSAGVRRKARRPTKPSHASRQKRLDAKTKRGSIKSQRKKVDY